MRLEIISQVTRRLNVIQELSSLRVSSWTDQSCDTDRRQRA